MNGRYFSITLLGKITDMKFLADVSGIFFVHIIIDRLHIMNSCSIVDATTFSQKNLPTSVMVLPSITEVGSLSSFFL